MTAKKLGGLGRGLGAIYDDFDVSGLSEEDGDDKRLETVKLDDAAPWQHSAAQHHDGRGSSGAG